MLYKGESETGVSIHFVEEGIDSGEIIVQERFEVRNDESFGSLVKRNYEIAPAAMVRALDKLAEGTRDFLPNDDAQATYNTVPSLNEALAYRRKRGLF